MGLSYNPSSVSDGIVLYLDAANPRSYAGTGTTWYDISGNSNNATFVDSPTYLSVPQPYFNFDGVNDYMRIVRSPSMSPTSGLTQEVWFNYTSIPATTIFIGLQYGASTNNTYALFKDANLIYGGVNTSGSFNAIGTGTTNLVGNRWYHFVHTYDGSTQKLYLDGVLMTTGSQSGTIQYDVNNTRVLIGADDNSGYNSGASYPHPGKMGQVRIYNRGLSAAEVLKNYNAQRKRYFQEDNIVTNGLMVYLDAANTRSYPGTGNTWYDLIGNRNFTLQNNPSFIANSAGGSIGFTAASQHYASSGASLPLMTRFTVEVWHYYTGNNSGLYPSIVAEGYPGSTNQINYVLGGVDGLTIGFYNGAWNISSAYTLTAGNWYHLVGNFDGANLRLYVNGVNQVTTANTGTPTVNTGGIRLMRRWDYDEYWGGHLSTVKIYNRALTSQEILQNYNATKGRFGL
jgi:hypothetical protein